MSRVKWLQTVIDGCNGVIEDGADPHAAWQQTIVADVTELRDRLQLELSGLTAG